MTAGDLLNKKFSKSKMGGYRIPEVDGFLVDAAELFSKQTREIAELKRKLDGGQQKLAEYEKDRDSLREALVSAQKLADNIVRDARNKADLTMRDAQIKAEKIVERGRQEAEDQQQALVELKKEVSDFRSRLLDMYRDHLRLITSLPALAEDEPEEPAQAAEPSPDAEPAAEGEPDETAEAAPEEPETDEAAQPSAQPETPAAPDDGADTAGQTADEAAATADPNYHVRLNVRYDEQSGEYVPIQPDEDKPAGED